MPTVLSILLRTFSLKKVLIVSSYFDLRWRDEDLDKYSTDKLYYIWNVLKQPLSPEVKPMLGELKWRRTIQKRTDTVEKIKKIISQRPDKNNLRQEWLKKHPNNDAQRTGKTISELAKLLPNMKNQLGAYIELKDIEIKYFGNDGEPYYELTDFRDIFPKNYAGSGFKQYGITIDSFLSLFDQIDRNQFNQLIKQIDLEQTEDGKKVIPYYDAVELKQILTQ